MPRHTVEQGETIATIARDHGHPSWRAIYGHAENAELRERRPNPFVLAPGDEVFVPPPEPAWVEVHTGRAHVLVARREPHRLRLTLIDEGLHRDPLAGLRFRLEIGGQVIDGVTDDRGQLQAEVPIEAAGEGLLTIWESEDDEDVLEWTVYVGHLDPVETPAGVWARLENLAFDCGDDGEGGGESTARALTAFGWAARIADEDPERDDKIRRALVRAHGS